METDVKLGQGDGTYVVIEGRILKVTATDLILDANARRKNQRGPRRALVHNVDDGLTINYNRDYPGGVTINDVVALTNRRKGITVADLRVIEGYKYGEDTGGDANIAKVASIAILGEIMIEPDPQAALLSRSSDSQKDIGSEAPKETVSLQRIITDLQNEVARLTERLAKLEQASSKQEGV